MAGEITRRRLMQAAAATMAVVPIASLAAEGPDTELRWGSTLPPTLDPHTILDAPSSFPRTNVYDSLFRYVGEGLDLQPHVVADYELSSDRRSYRFHLKSGIRFHDGTPMTAADAVYSLKRLLTLGKGPASLFADVLEPGDLAVVDETTFSIELGQPYAPLTACLVHVAVVNSRLVEANAGSDMGQAWIAANDAGSGAYRIVEGSFSPTQQLDLVRNTDYFLPFASKTPIEKVYCRSTVDDTTRILALEKGDIDTTTANLRPVQIDKLKSEPGIDVYVSDPMRVFITHMCTRRAPFDNVNFRRAIACAFPYETYIQKVLKGTVERNGIPLPKTMWGAPADAGGYAYDLDKAKAYLDQAAAEGADITRPLEYVSVQGSDATGMVGQLLQSELRKIGVTVEITSALWSNIVQRAQKLETSPDLVSLWASSYILDPHTFFAPYTSGLHGSIQGASWFADADIEARITAASQEGDRDLRIKAYEQLARDLVDQTPTLWYYAGVFARGVRHRVKGFNRNSLTDDVPVAGLWLES